jgi:DNA-binding MltR family transcriptional regulator
VTTVSKKKSTKETFDSLSQQTKELYNDLDKESDRGAALLGAAFLDESLEAMLRMFFVDDSSLADELLGTDRPLGSFSARIRTAYAIGLLGREMYADLETVRSIRNDFAHDHRGLSFDNQSLADRARNLKAWANVNKQLGWNATPRVCFIMGVSMLANKLILRGLSLQHAKPGEDFRVVQHVQVE